MQSKKILSSIIAISIIALLSGCDLIDKYLGDEEKIPRQEEKIARELPPKEVEIFDLSTSEAKLYLTQSALLESSQTVSVSPQISGKITKVTVKKGDKVDANSLLIELGDSLNTNILDTQLESAEIAADISAEAENQTEKLGQNNIKSADVSVEIAKNVLQSAQTNKSIAVDSYQLQLQNSEIELDNAEIAYKNTKSSLNDLKDALDDMEDNLEDIEDKIADLEGTDGSSSTIQALEEAQNQLESTISSTEAQIDNSKYALEIAENREEQAEIAINLLETSFQSQQNQLNLAIANAFEQYKAACLQAYGVVITAKLQDLQAEGQLLQSLSNEKISRLQTDNKRIYSPISGVVTEIIAEEGNLTSPGQTLIIIESTDQLIAKTSLPAEKKDLVKIGDQVLITNDSLSQSGIITSISPVINDTTKKIDIEISLDKTDQLLAGGFSKVQFPINTQKSIYIPLNSIFLDGDQKFVRIVSVNNKVEHKPVKTGQIIDEFIEITDGLIGNEKIITSVNTFLQEDEKVLIANK